MKRNFNIDELEKKLSPKIWSIEWGSLQLEDDFGVKDNHFFIHSTKKLTLYGPSLTQRSQNYQLELTITVPADSTADETQIELGFYHYGLVTPGPHIVKTAKIAKGKTETVVMPIHIDNDFANFRPMLSVSGDIRFDKCVLSADLDQIKHDKLTLIEGTLTEISAIPDPKKSDYPDCRFITHLVGNSIIDGVPCPKEVNLVIEGFRNYKMLNTSNLKAGDKIRLLMLPFESLPDEKKSTQQADDLNLFSLDNYYCIGLSKINDFHDEGKIPESGIYFNDSTIEYVSVFERHINPPIPPELVKAQQDAIAVDLAKINAMLEPWTDARKDETNKAFKIAWEKEKAKDADKGKDYNRVKVNNRTYVWRNMDNSFWCLPENYTLIGKYNPVSQDKMDALIALKDFFEANGCQFIVSLVPGMYDISARVINKDFKDVPDFYTAYVVKQFLESGIETVYGSDEIIKNYNRYPWTFFYPSNSHPSDVTQDVLSDLLVVKLSRYGFLPNLDSAKLSIRQFQHEYGNANDYLWPQNCDIGNNVSQTAYTNRQVIYDGNPLQYDKNSPILVLGNSFIQTPMLSPDSIPTLLAYKIHCNTNAYRVGGNGPMTIIAQHLFNTPEKFLKGRKVVILHVGTVHFRVDDRFNNINDMDQQTRILSGKKLIYSAELQGNSQSETYKNAKNACLHTVDKSGKSILIELLQSECKYDTNKEIAVAINGWCLSTQNVVVKINDETVKFPVFNYDSLGRNSMSAVMLPVGTEKITVEITGTPGHEVSIKNIQLFQ